MSKKVSGWPLIAPTEVDTGITGDQILEALAADVEASDNRKVLTAAYGGLEGEETGSVMWGSPLPIIGEGDAGKVLTVNAGETGAEWAEPSGGGESIYHITGDGQGGYTLTETWAALSADVVAGNAIRFVIDGVNGNAIVSPQIGVGGAVTQVQVIMMMYMSAMGGMGTMIYTITQSGVTVTEGLISVQS